MTYAPPSKERSEPDPGRMASRLDTLSRRHRAIEAEIRVETARPVPDAGALQRLKRTRLRLKEQIVALTTSRAANGVSA